MFWLEQASIVEEESMEVGFRTMKEGIKEREEGEEEKSSGSRRRSRRGGGVVVGFGNRERDGMVGLE